MRALFLVRLHHLDKGGNSRLQLFHVGRRVIRLDMEKRQMPMLTVVPLQHFILDREGVAGLPGQIDDAVDMKVPNQFSNEFGTPRVG